MVKMKVTQSHIDQGRQWACKYCPIALALRDGGFEQILVRQDHARFFKEGHEYVVHLGWRAKWFIWRFDRGMKVWPFTLRLKGV